MDSEDPYSFLFQFDILCHTYGYTDNTHKLRLFPATLKTAALKWFMGLGEHSITSWDDMRKIFLKKYQAYCRSKYLKDDIFKMSQQEDESLEEYLERFLYNLQKSKYTSLTSNIIKTIFLKGIQDEYFDALNVMGKGYVSYSPFDEIIELCQMYSRGRARKGKRDIT